MKDFQFITSSHPSYVENLYNDFAKDPETVDPELRKFFEGFDFAISNGKQPSVNGSAVAGGAAMDKEFSVYRLIQAYRKKGHLIADTNPIRPRKDRKANLDLSFFGLGEGDMETKFSAGKFIGLEGATLKDILAKIKRIYTAKIGMEYSAINNQEKIEWLANALEKDIEIPLTLDQRKRILQKLNEGVMFEKFLHTKYVGQKRFSLEGGENTIVGLDAIIDTAASNGVQEIVIGMAHRGRLNVLANTIGKTYEQIFSEFEGNGIPDTTMGSGDVKYHLGFSSEQETAGGHKVHVKLAPNPSHLEAVDPVVEGFCRSKADVMYESNYASILPILIHGDASIAGQGIVYEVTQMSKLMGYYTGGTIHFVINNQIGFTTDYDDARSSDYCTGLAAIIQAPVFHVNGDDAEAIFKVSKIATEYRQKFKEDIFIDLLCYRRHGHNEGDEPKFTQPQLYAMIEKHANPREVYTKFLSENGEADAKELAAAMEKKFIDDLQDRLDEVKQKPLPYTYQAPELKWKELRKATAADFVHSPDTAISPAEFKEIFEALMHIPEGFQPLRKVDKLLRDKVKLFNEEGKVDWATGELLAYSSLLINGIDVRMSGQDVKRGTFSHRHAVIRDENTNEPYCRLDHIKEGQKPFRIYNSLLSEYAVLGFEYGYALANPNALVLWEAQFGDFVNGAQTMIDQFVTGAEMKWQRMNGLVLLLPHGYEGQGPEHSSGRMERFLQACADLNIVVTNVTTAANFFHLLRRQVAWPFRKPLVNFSPKANLRHPGSYSTEAEFTTGGFKELIDDATLTNPAEIKKVLLCSGKLFFELEEHKKKNNISDTAVVRLEQLYPLPSNQLQAVADKYPAAVFVWVQEEPQNMGAASYLRMNLDLFNFTIVSRKASAATATGYGKIHMQEQDELIQQAFSL